MLGRCTNLNFCRVSVCSTCLQQLASKATIPGTPRGGVYARRDDNRIGHLVDMLHGAGKDLIARHLGCWRGNSSTKKKYAYVRCAAQPPNEIDI